MKVHYSKNKYPPRLDTVENTIGKTIRETPANIAFDYRPGCGVSEYVLNSRIDLKGKVAAQPWLTGFKVVDCFEEFSFCLRMK